MVTLASVTKKFEVKVFVVDGGSGVVSGVLDETAQSDPTTSVFAKPGHIFRCRVPNALDAGMVVQTQHGDVYIVGDNGPSESKYGTLWESFRLYAANRRQVTWQTRVSVIDQITQLKKDTRLSDPQMIWIAEIPLPQEQFDRGIHVDFEQTNFITNANVKIDDVVDNRNVTKVDKLLGLSVGVLT